MNYLSKDISYEIAYNLDFKTVFEYSLLYKKNHKLWNDYSFWYNYLFKNYKIKYDNNIRRINKDRKYIKPYIYWLDKIKQKYNIYYYKLPKTVDNLRKKYKYFSVANFYAFEGDLNKLKELSDIDNWNHILLYAAKGGHLNIIKWVEDNFIMPDYQDAACFAAKGGHKKVLDYCMTQYSCFTNEILYFAVKGGHRDIIETLLQKSTYKNYNGLMKTAAVEGHKNIVEWMIELGADSFLEAASYAACGNHKDLVIYILGHITGEIDWNILVKDVGSFGHKDMLEWLIEQGADDYQTILIDAVKEGLLDIVKWVVVELGVNDFQKPLLNAGIFDRIEVINYLVEQGAEVNEEVIEYVSRQGAHKSTCDFLRTFL